jgi:hypothetical protein
LYDTRGRVQAAPGTLVIEAVQLGALANTSALLGVLSIVGMIPRSMLLSLSRLLLGFCLYTDPPPLLVESHQCNASSDRQKYNRCMLKK